MKVESSQSGGDYGVVLWTVRAGEEPPLHTHSREDELVYVVQGQLVARVGDTRVEVGPGAYAALPRGAPHTIEVVGDQATLLVSFVPGGLERFGPPGRRAARPGRFRADFALGMRTAARGVRDRARGDRALGRDAPRGRYSGTVAIRPITSNTQEGVERPSP